MKKFTLACGIILFVFCLFSSLSLKAQSHDLKGNGEIFYSEEFDWGNPDDPKGWTMPEGYYLEDPDDLGFNWQWWPNDSLIAEWTFEPPFQSTSKENGHLCNFLNVYNNWIPLGDQTPLNNAIVFPTIDCSSHSSVIVRYETHFMNYSHGDAQFLMVSVDAGVHWASFDVGFGCSHKDRPEDKPPGIPAIFEANISEVAAGAPEVIIKFLWQGVTMYFWLIDDFQLSEAYDNDLRLKHISLEWDDGDDNTAESFTYLMPKSQLGGAFTSFQSSVLNFGEFDQNDRYLEMDISKNSQSVYNLQSESTWISPLILDTISLEGSYAPEDYGHYKIKYAWHQSEQDISPENNMKEIFFHVTDSVYSRSDDEPELPWAYGYERYQDGFGEEFHNIDHFIGSIFPIYGDCEVESVSAYIMGGQADGLIDFRYTLFWKPPLEEDPDNEGAISILTTEAVELDSSMFNTWVTLPFEKDGESEFLLAGDLVYAGLQYNNYHDSKWDRRNKNIAIGVDMSTPLNDKVAIGWDTGAWYEGLFVTKRNPMIRLNLNDHGNQSDGVDLNNNLSSLSQNYPNPFRNMTEISYSLNSAENVIIEISDISGRTVLVIEEGLKPAGEHIHHLMAGQLESGIYFYTLKAGQFKETKRMVISE